MESLLKSLLERDAIPDIRLNIFTDPELAATGRKSPRQIFEANGTAGNEIYRHPHFANHLRYFVNGPDLPSEVVVRFCELLNRDGGTSDKLLDQLQRYIRSAVRQHELEQKPAAEEFYKLALEVGLDFERHSIRRAAMSVR